MKNLLLVALVASSTVFAQGKVLSTVRSPNEGASRVYLGTPDELYEAAMVTCRFIGLEFTRSPDGSVFIATPTPWTKPSGRVTFTRTLIGRVRQLNPKETELVVEEENRGGPEPTGDSRVSYFHDRIGERLGEFRPKKAVIPRHAQEAAGEALIIRESDLVQMRVAEETDTLREWNLAFARSNPVNTAIVKLKGDVPLHFTASERRFLVMEGSVKFTVGGKSSTVSAGDFVVVPKNVRAAMELGRELKATLFVVEMPPIDDSKTVWLEPKDKKPAVDVADRETKSTDANPAASP